MARHKTTGPTERELDILTVLWEIEVASAREVHEAISTDITFSTVQTMLNVMFEKGFVGREIKGRGFVYQTEVSRTDIEQDMVGTMLERVFSGSAKRLLARALSVQKTSPEDLDEIQALIDQARKKQ